jgi:hypothetical protein
MNLDVHEFSPSNETGTRATNNDAEHLLSTLLKTDFQLLTAQSILHEWNTATTLSALTRAWSTRHANQPIERNRFSLLLYNISSLRIHLEDIIDYISASYPNIWALTGLHFNNDANYPLASYFKSRYTIYYQHGSNSFGGVCLAIAREVPHRIAPEFNNIDNLIAADVFDSNKTYTVAVVYSPPTEEVPIVILNRLHRHNQNLILIGDFNARHSDWHDVTNNSDGHRLAAWIDEKPNLTIFNSSQPTSTRSRAVIDPIIAPSNVSTELAKTDQNVRVTDHYPVHWRLSSFKSHSEIEYEIKRIDWVMFNCVLTLKQNFFFTLSEQMRHQSIDFILVYEAFLVALQERKMHHLSQDPKLSTHFAFVFGEYYQAEIRILCLYRSTRLEAYRSSLYSLNKCIHHELESGQASSVARVLSQTRVEKYATLFKPLKKAFQGKSNFNSRLS